MALQWHPHVAPSNGTDIPTSVVAGLPHPPHCTNLYHKSLAILDIVSHLVVCGSDTSVPGRSPRPHRINEPRSHFVHVKYSFHLRKVMLFCTYTYLGSQFNHPWTCSCDSCGGLISSHALFEWVKSWNHSLDSGHQRKTGIEFAVFPAVKATGSQWNAVFATGMN